MRSGGKEGEEFGGVGRGGVEEAGDADEDGGDFPLAVLVAELAADAVGARAVLPEPVALLFPEARAQRSPDELLGAVGEAALPGVGASSKFREVLAQFGLVFEGVGF